MTLAANPHVEGTPIKRSATQELVVWELVMDSGEYQGHVIGEIHAGQQNGGWIITFTEQCSLRQPS
jgi:hypothetical protein